MDSLCQRCHGTGWALCVVNWNGQEKQASHPCSCPAGREIRVDYKGVFRTEVVYVRESGFAEFECPECGCVHVRDAQNEKCTRPKVVRDPIVLKQLPTRPPLSVEYVGADKAANDTGGAA